MDLETPGDAATVWRGAARGVAVGLLLMGVFTAMWAGWALAGPVPLGLQIVSIAFWTVSALFVVAGVQLMVVARKLPVDTRGPSLSPGSQIRRRFGLVFAAEGILIGITCGALGGIGLFEFTAPAVCLIVGVHFLPMAWVFDRRIDLWLGSIAIAIGVVGLTWVLVDQGDYLSAWTFVGYSTAAITTTYGINMLITKHRMLHAAIGRTRAGATDAH